MCTLQVAVDSHAPVSAKKAGDEVHTLLLVDPQGFLPGNEESCMSFSVTMIRTGHMASKASLSCTTNTANRTSTIYATLLVPTRDAYNNASSSELPTIEANSSPTLRTGYLSDLGTLGEPETCVPRLCCGSGLNTTPTFDNGVLPIFIYPPPTKHSVMDP
jgi:hypothetical protein